MLRILMRDGKEVLQQLEPNTGEVIWRDVPRVEEERNRELWEKLQRIFQTTPGIPGGWKAVESAAIELILSEDKVEALGDYLRNTPSRIGYKYQDLAKAALEWLRKEAR